MRRTSIAALALTFLFGCGNRNGTSALLVKINLDPALQTTCIDFQVRAMDGTTLTSRQLDPAVATDHELRVALYRDKLDPQVQLFAQPLFHLGGGCTGAVLNGQADQQTGTFPGAGVNTVLLSLKLPEHDQDGDHFADDGPDCAPNDVSSYPGAPEQCLTYVDHDCNGFKGCDDTSSCRRPDCVAPPGGVALAAAVAPPSVVGTCLGVTVSPAGADGQTQKSPSDVQVNLSATLANSQTSGVTLYMDSGCSTPLPSTQLTIPAKTDGAVFFFKGTRAGVVTLTADASSLGNASLAYALNAASATVLHIPPLNPVTVGYCNPMTIQAQDIYGNPSTPATDTNISVNSNPSGVSFYLDATCATATSSVVLPASNLNGTVGVYFKANSAGPFTLSAFASGFMAGNQTVTAVAAVPKTLNFTTAAQPAVPAGSCSNPITIQLLDAANNPVLVTSATTVNISSSGSTPVSFFTDSNCNTAAGGSVNIPVGSSTATFYFRGTKTGSYNVTASLTSPALSNQQQETIIPGAPAAFDFVSAAQTVTVNNCSAIVNVRVLDAYGNPATFSSNTTVTLSGSNGLLFYSNNTCTTQISSTLIGAGSGTTSFYFKGPQVTPSATVTLIAPPLPNGIQTEDIAPGTPVALFLSGSPQQVQVTRCSAAMTVTTQDSAGNPSPVSSNTAVTLGTSGTPTLSFYSDPSCSTSLPQSKVTIAAGTATSPSFYFASSGLGTTTLTASANGFSGDSQSEMITPGPPSKLVFTTGGGQSKAAGLCSGIVTVQAQDSVGNPSTGGSSLTVSLASTIPNLTFYSDATCTSAINPATVTIAGSDSSASTSFYFADLTGGTGNITASSGTLTTAQATETIIGMVRSGICTIQGGSSSANCSISPALSDVTKAFVVFQAANSDGTAASTSVICSINNPAQLVCSRAASTGTNAMTVTWYVAQFVSPNVSVQHYGSVACAGTTTTKNLTTPVSASESFLLVSSQVNQTDATGQASRLAALAVNGSNGTAVNLINSQGCGTNDVSDIQVVTITGSNVTRGSTGTWAGANKTATAPAPSGSLGGTALLYSYRTNTTSTGICDRLVRGDQDAAGTTLTFYRGAGAGGTCTNGGGSSIDDLAFERVQFPAGFNVQTGTVNMNAGTTTGSLALSPAVDTTRTIVLAGGQWAAGQVMGETSSASNLIVGEARATTTLTSTNLTLTRTSSAGAANFTPYVIELLP